ncbi:type II toxin-antitoxin system RelE/ParE family toxin [Kaistia dalseonensis]|uniref:mRNA interferase RelE/StbE n=1 Tax=Kaistia dalseonensis TaxID=410840 RepID=A0ABU0H6L5_9HYPH|nr:type II toxin-antitoxin system RelE/ParE family toxin [Kaistia dalseonensis]MCX5495363.1 type II toxin-antitoxin system RelE/ParE family toxin [Kaistia dalseonensis]MDQ0437949.1 mRNA interferase RelE/StbE [Kaistia dalseonensis]
MKQIAFSKDALRTLRKIPANVAKTIRAKIDLYAANPAALANNVTELKGEAGIQRLRVGDWRVIFSEDGSVIAIIRIAPRGEAYD